MFNIHRKGCSLPGQRQVRERQVTSCRYFQPEPAASALPLTYLKSTQVCLLILLLILFAGCTRGLTPEYGQSKGTSGSKGINGFGTLRKSFESNGWKTRDVSRLSDRLQSVDAIVWIPTTHEAVEGDAVRWLHDWLGDQPRTLIYIIPDEGNEARYWEQARNLAPPQQRLEYRRRHARAITNLMNGPYGGATAGSEEIDRLWFKAKMLRNPRPRWQILPHSTVTTIASPATAAVPPATVFLPSADWTEGGYELGDNDLQLQPLINDAQGNPLAVRIFTPDQNPIENDIADGELSTDGQAPEVDPAVLAELNEEWIDESEWMDDLQMMQLRNRRRNGHGIGDSEIIVVAGGSLVSNFGMVTDEGRQIAKRLLAESAKRSDPTTPRVGFITSGFSGVPVSNPNDQPQMATGLELLTVWPLNIIMLHLALMGIVACMILFPIFGRPRKLLERNNSDFADHINAVASLLHRSNGEHYARQRISEYFRKVRGETSGPWVMPLPVVIAPPAKPVATDTVEADSVDAKSTSNPLSEPQTVNSDQSHLEPKHERNEP